MSTFHQAIRCCVYVADPKQSKIDIVQAALVGLFVCLPNKEYGSVIVPVVLDENSEEAGNVAFNQIVNVISAMGMHDDRIIEQFKNPLKRGNGGNIVLIDSNINIEKVKFNELISSINFQGWNRLTFGWYVGYESLKASCYEINMRGFTS